MFPPEPEDNCLEDNPLESLKGEGAGQDRSVHIFVSLYLILIAFFMVLNAFSNQETAKAAAVMDSVNSAFKKIHLPKVSVVDLLARDQLDAHSDVFYEEVEGVLAGLVGFPGQYPSRGGNVLKVELPAAILFEGTELHIRADQTRFINELADLLKRQAIHEQREVEILFGAPDAIMGEAADWQALFVRRAANIAMDLEDRGVAGQSISTGIIAAPTPSVWLTFSSRQEKVLGRDRRGGE